MPRKTQKPGEWLKTPVIPVEEFDALDRKQAKEAYARVVTELKKTRKRILDSIEMDKHIDKTDALIEKNAHGPGPAPGGGDQALENRVTATEAVLASLQRCPCSPT